MKDKKRNRINFAELRKNKDLKEKKIALRDGKGRITFKKVFLPCLIAMTTGCTGGVYVGNHDMVQMGSKEGVDALADHNIGLVNEGKTTPDTTGAHYKLRNEIEKTKRIEATRGGFFGWLKKPAFQKTEDK